MAKSSFIDGRDGARLFYTNGPWSRPYLVPDAATEERLLTRQSWLMAVLVLVLLPLLALTTPSRLDPRAFVLSLIAALIALQVVSWVLLRPVVAGLSKSTERAPLALFYRGTAERHGFPFLAICLIGSCAFFLFSVGSLLTRLVHPIVAVTGSVIFGLVSASWVYVLLLKLRMRRPVPGRTA
jgi:hypothetical protein